MNFSSTAGYNRTPRSVLAHQHLVVLLLDAGDSDHVAGIVELKLRLVEHVLSHFAHVPDQVRHEALARIQTAVRHDRVQFGQFVTMRFNERQLVRRDVFFEKNWLVLGHGGEMTHTAAYLLRGHVQALGNENGVGIQVPTLIAQQQRGKGRIVVYDRPSFAIENFAAGSKNGNVADAVLLRLQRVEVLLHDLEAP